MIPESRHVKCIAAVVIPEGISQQVKQVVSEVGRICPLVNTRSGQLPHISEWYLGRQTSTGLNEAKRAMEKRFDILEDARLTLGDFVLIGDPRHAFLALKVVGDRKKLLRHRAAVAGELHQDPQSQFWRPHVSLGKVDILDPAFQKVRPRLETLMRGVELSFRVEETAVYGIGQKTEVARGVQKLRHVTRRDFDRYKN